MRERGFNQLATAESLGAYEGTVGVARRGWATAHETELIGFIRAYRAGVDWLYDRANRDVVEAMLVANIRDMSPALAKQSYDLLLADKGGITRDIGARHGRHPHGARAAQQVRRCRRRR